MDVLPLRRASSEILMAFQSQAGGPSPFLPMITPHERPP